SPSCCCCRSGARRCKWWILSNTARAAPAASAIPASAKGRTVVTESPRLNFSAAQLRPLLPVLAVVLVALALWLAWTGFQQSRDNQRTHALQQTRDQVAQGTARALQKQADAL